MERRGCDLEDLFVTAGRFLAFGEVGRCKLISLCGSGGRDWATGGRRYRFVRGRECADGAEA